MRVPRLALDDRYLAQELPLLGDRQFIRSTLTPAEVRPVVVRRP